MTSGNFHCTTKTSSFNCSRLCLPSQLPYDHHHYFSSQLLVKFPLALYSVFQAAEREETFPADKDWKTPFLVHRTRIVNLAWYGALSLAMIPSLLSILARHFRPSAHLQGMCEPMVGKGSGSRRNKVAWVCVQGKFAQGLPLHLSLEVLHPFSFCSCFLWHNRPAFLCCSKCTWLSGNSVAWSGLCCKV